MIDVVVALDAGGTKLLGGLVARDGTVLHRDEVATPRGDDGRCDPGLARLRALAHRLRERSATDGHRVCGAGLGIAEYVRDGELTSAEVFDWSTPPAEVLADLPGPVVVEADVRCAALAEAAARGLGHGDSMLYVSWGTGLSSTLVLDGACVAGHRGEALALGEWTVDSEPAVTLERYASGRGIAERWTRRTGRAKAGREVADLALAGDPEAGEIVRSAADAIAAALASLVKVLDPGVLVLGGGVGTSDGPLPARVTDQLPGLLHRPGTPPVEPARAGADAGLVGAALMAWRRDGSAQ